MRRNRNDEYGFDPRMESTYLQRDEYTYAPEYQEADNEEVPPPEFKETAPEYGGRFEPLPFCG